MEKQVELRRIGLASAIKIGCLLGLSLGFLEGFITSLLHWYYSPTVEWVVGPESLAPILGLALGPGAILAVPIVYGTFGALSAGLVAKAYNYLAPRLGGIQILLHFPADHTER
jgi:hypothetical protein